jgi:thiol-disulfide isomerase/thioredoxin
MNIRNSTEKPAPAPLNETGPCAKFLKPAVTVSLVGLWACLAQARPDAVERDFTGPAQALVQLLKDRDAAKFAKALAPSLEDWRAAVSSNHWRAGEDKLGPQFQKSLTRDRDKVEATAKLLLARAAELRLDFTQAEITAKPTSPARLGGTRRGDVQAEDEFLPFVEKLEVVLSVEPRPGIKEGARLRGDYTVAWRDMIRFPTGWRSSEGPLWVAFPAGLADEKTQRELTILQRAATYQGLAQAEDPALTRLGEGVLDFMRNRDAKRFESKVLDADQQAKLAEAAHRVIEQLDRFGISFDDAVLQLKDVSFESLIARGGLGQIDGVEGDRLTVRFSVKSARKARTGAGLSGEYAIKGDEAVRKAGQWSLTGKIQWSQFPDGVLDESAATKLKVENYVAEHDTLPPGMAAPDVQLVRMDNQQRVRLASLRGKVVVLDFWAVNCGPCQEPLQKMQKYFEEHPAWKGRVELVPVSIDDTLKAARDHLARHGWTNTFNVWAGTGGWKSPPAQEFRIVGIPTCYIINPAGMIAEAGYTGLLDIPELVDGLLK